MSLDEARQIKWMYPPHPTLGELWDRDELTIDNLKHALRKGHRQLRRAARILLDELERSEPARALYSAPDADARPAAGSSPSVSIRPATMYASPFAAAPAPALLLHYGARVVVASDYLEDQESFHGWLLAYYVGLGVGAAALTINTMFWLLRGQALWLTILSILANVAAWIWFVVVVRQQIGKVRTFRAGRKGEEQVVEQLRTALDNRWTIYRNLQLPNRKDDLDLVLVGPGGVWAVQVKAFGVPLRFHAGAWEYQRAQRWARCDPKHDPAQVTRQATRLNEFFKTHGIRRFVERAIALAERQPADLVEDSEIPVWLPFNIAERAAALSTRYPPAADELGRINELLGRRADEQRAVEKSGKRHVR